MVDHESPFEEHLLDVAVAGSVPQVPRDGLYDQSDLRVPASEVAADLPLQLEDKGVEDHGPAPGRSQQAGQDG